VLFKSEAENFIKKNKKIGLKFFIAFKELAENSDLKVANYDIVIMKSKKNTFRLRIGKYRAIFIVEDEIRVLTVEKIASRGEVYKK